MRGYGIISPVCIRKYRYIYQVEVVPCCSLWHFQYIPQVSVPFTARLLPAESFTGSWWVTESQNGRGWNGPLWVIWSNPPAEAGSPTVGCRGPCPGRSWISPEKETPQPPWAACSSAPSPSEGRSSSSRSDGTAYSSVCAHCPLSCHWAPLKRVIVWFMNLRKISIHLMWMGLFPWRELWGLQICHKLHFFSSQHGFISYKHEESSLILPLNRQQDQAVNRDGCVFEVASMLITAFSIWEF